MKVIFLDIDGVLNYDKFIKENMKYFDRLSGNYLEIDEEKVKLLSNIVNETGAFIVLSSSWKNFWDKKTLIPKDIKSSLLTMLFMYYGIYIHDITPNIGKREDEIGEWLRLHPEVTSYVVIDDDLGHVKKFKDNNHLVKTSFYDSENGGLTELKVEEAIKILKLNNK